MDPNNQVPQAPLEQQPAPQLPPQPAPSPAQPPQYDYKHNPLAVMQSGEQTVCEIKRHPFGLFSMYASMGFGLLALAVVIIIAPHYISALTGNTQMLLLLAYLIVVAATLLFAYIATTIYKNNRWILTTDSLTQVTQIGLFRKQVSQLSLANLEDVTAQQDGVIQSMFNFGTLHAETAGERSKFVFPFCPDPNAYARQVLACREAYIRNDPEGAERANDLLEVPRYNNNNSQ